MKNRKATAEMSREELIAELHRLNPFAGYANGSKLPTESLRESLRRFRGELPPAGGERS